MDQEFKDSPFGEEYLENIRLENEIMKLKLLAQFGDDMKIEMLQPVPPEVERSFLENIKAFESARREESIKLFDFLGQPAFKPAVDLTDEELGDELTYLLKLLHDKRIVLHTLADYDPRTIYAFITTELFEHTSQLKDGMPAGMAMHFIYEDFHPNHRYDIDQCCNEFLNDWFNQSFNAYNWHFPLNFILPDGTLMPRPVFLSKVELVFAAYNSFSGEEFVVNDIDYNLDESGDTGSGHAGGYVKYNAVLENNELLTIEGNFKLCLQYGSGWWKIMYFTFPGFEWS